MNSIDAQRDTALPDQGSNIEPFPSKRNRIITKVVLVILGGIVVLGGILTIVGAVTVNPILGLVGKILMIIAIAVSAGIIVKTLLT